MFQTIYAAPQVWWPLMVLSLEWWTAVILMLGLAPVLNPAAALAKVGVLGSLGFSPFANPLLLLPVLMLLTTFGVSLLVAGQASPPVHQRRWWSRLLIAAMHVAQPVERGWARYRTRFETIVIPEALHGLRRSWARRTGALVRRAQLDLWSENWTSREKLLESLLALTAEAGWFVRLDPGWNCHDVRFYGDRWCKADLVTVTENHGGGKLLTRVRLKPAATLFQKALLVLLGYVLVFAWGFTPTAALLVSPLLVAWVVWLHVSGARLRSVVMASVLTVAERLGMTVVGEPKAFEKPHREPQGSLAALPMPMPGRARLATALSVPSLVRRTARL